MQILYSNHVFKLCIHYALSKDSQQTWAYHWHWKRTSDILTCCISMKSPTVGHRRTPTQAAPHNPPLVFLSVVEVEAIAGRVQGRNHNMLQLTAIFRFEFWHLFQSSVWCLHNCLVCNGQAADEDRWDVSLPRKSFPSYSLVHTVIPDLAYRSRLSSRKKSLRNELSVPPNQPVRVFVFMLRRGLR